MVVVAFLDRFLDVFGLAYILLATIKITAGYGIRRAFF